jgi:hypothetical protein
VLWISNNQLKVDRIYRDKLGVASGFALWPQPKDSRSALADPANCFSPSPFFSPPQFLAKAAKSGLRRKTKDQKFLFEKNLITY